MEKQIPQSYEEEVTASDYGKEIEARIWEQAREEFETQLKKEYDTEIIKGFLKDKTSIEEVQGTATKLRGDAESKYNEGYVTIGGKKLFKKERIAKLLDKIEQLANIGDLAVKAAPETVGLVWCGFRMMLSVVLKDIETCTLFSGACDSILNILFHCKNYVRLYRANDRVKEAYDTGKRVLDSIPKIYCEVLLFSFFIRRHLDKINIGRVLKGLVSPPMAKFQPKVDHIMQLDAQLRTDVQLAFESEMMASQGDNKAMLSSLNQTVRSEFNASREMFESTLSSTEEMKDLLKGLIQLQKDKGSPYDRAKKEYATLKQQILDRTPEIDPEIVYTQNLRRRCKGTCKWIFETEKYKEWRSSDKNDLLWVSARAGYGKSILISTVIEKLQSEQGEMKNNAMLLYYFIRTGTDPTEHALGIMKNINVQLYVTAYNAHDSPQILVDCNDHLKASNKSTDDKRATGKARTFSKQIAVYQQLAKVIGRPIYLILDAGDECSDRKEEGFFEGLKELLETPGIKLKILLTSRPEPDITEAFAGSSRIVATPAHNKSDMMEYVSSELNHLAGFTESEKALALSKIVENSSGAFRYATLAIDSLRKPWQRPLQKKLDSLPEGLDNSYHHALRDMDPTYWPLLRTALTWKVLSQGDITVQEVIDIYSRIFVADGFVEDATENGADETNELGVELIQTAGGPFLESKKVGDEWIVDLRHPSVKDFALREICNDDTQGDSSVPSVCRRCERTCEKCSHFDTFTISPKKGHLDICITIFEHLTSRRFQRRHLSSYEVEEEDGETKRPAEEESKAGASEGQQQDTSRFDDEKNATSDRTLQNFDAKELADEVKTTDGDTVEKLDDFAAEERANGTGSNESEIIRPKVKENGTEEKAKDDENKDSEEEGEYNKDDDNRSDDTDYNRINNLEIKFSSETETETKRLRYELLYWPYHLKEAEKLWSAEERTESPQWTYLWELIEKFFYENSKMFKAWQIAVGWFGPVSPLHIAAELDLTTIVERLVKREDVDVKTVSDFNGRTPLHYAAMNSNYGDPQIIEILLQNGAPLDTQDQRGFTPLLLVVSQENPKYEFAKYLLKRGANPNTADSDGWNALHTLACSNPYGGEVTLRIVKELIEDYGANLNAKDDGGETPLHFLLQYATESSPEMLDLLLQHGANVNEQDNQSQAPLYEAARMGNLSAVQTLLKHGADIDDDDEFGITATHIAAREGHVKIVEYLVNQGAKFNEPTKKGRTPLWLACHAGSKEVVEFLLTRLCDDSTTLVNVADIRGRTLLHKAAVSGKIDIVKAVLDRLDARTALNQKDSDHRATPLHAAAFKGFSEAVSLFLEKGADWKAQNFDGKTPLQLAYDGWTVEGKDNYETTVLRLIEVDVEAAVNDATLFDIAASKGSIDVMNKLIDGGADPNKKDEHGWTPLLIARQYGQKEAVELLSMRATEIKRSPKRWQKRDNLEKIEFSVGGLDLTFSPKPSATFEENHVSIRSDHPVRANDRFFYYEIDMVKDNTEEQYPEVGLGFCSQWSLLDGKMPGWYDCLAPSFGYHGGNGKLYGFYGPTKENIYDRAYVGASQYSPGDCIGCGIDYEKGEIFYTRNGEMLGVAFENVEGRLFPVVGFGAKASIRANFGQSGTPFKFDVSKVYKNAVPEEDLVES